MMKTYLEQARQIPISKEMDVLVAGGGTAGLAAAVAAGKNDARTLLVERNGMIGGVATAGLMLNWGIKNRYWDSFGEQVVTGIPFEISKRISARNPLKFDFSSYEKSPAMLTFDSETFNGDNVPLRQAHLDKLQNALRKQGVSL